MSSRLMMKRSALRRLAALAEITHPTYSRPIGDAGQLALPVTMRQFGAEPPKAAVLRFSSVLGRAGRRHRLLWVNGMGPFRVPAAAASQVLTGMTDVEVALEGRLWRVTLVGASQQEAWKEEVLWPLMGRFAQTWPVFPSENHVPREE